MRVLVVYCRDNRRASLAAGKLCSQLDERGIGYEVMFLEELPDCSQVLGLSPDILLDSRLDKPFRLIAVLGGDGSVLRAARLAVLLGTPVLGLNYGHLGFLSSPGGDDDAQLVGSALAGECRVEQLPCLQVEVELEGSAGSLRLFALNDVAVNRGASASIMEYSVGVCGCRLAALRGDGVVVASSTGSTAYALSAGGPVVAPGNRGLLVVPVAAHTMASRPVVTGPDDWVEVDLDPWGEGPQEGLSVQIDGELQDLGPGARRLLVRNCPFSVGLLRCGGEGFYGRVSTVFLKQ